jgi:membrane associated rhomboid family serine protease/Zn-finger nucleic acid-binding protein
MPKASAKNRVRGEVCVNGLLLQLFLWFVACCVFTFFMYGDDNESSTDPYVNWLLILVNLGVFVYEFFMLTPVQLTQFTERWASHPDHFTLLTAATSTFMHANLAHIFFNMLFLYIFGDNVEDRFGHVGYLIFYLAAGVFASFAHAHAVPDSARTLPSLGASGAISAVLGVYIVLFPWARVKYFLCVLVFFRRTVRIWAWLTIGLWFAGNALSQFAATARQSMDGVAYAAHVGGFLAGSVLSLVLVLSGLVEADWGPKKKSLAAYVPPLPHAEVHPIVDVVAGHFGCPGCQQTLHRLTLINMEVEECEACGGLWCDTGQAHKFLETEQLPAALRYPRVHEGLGHPVPAGQRECPRCHVRLLVTTAAGMEVDGCPKCKGTYFDKGELQALHAAFHQA